MSIGSKSGFPETVDLTPAQIQQLRQVRAIENMLAMDYHAMTLTGRDLPENVNVIGLISSGFDDLGVPPLLGRGLLPSDAIDGQEPQPVAVVSYRFWQEQLAGALLLGVVSGIACAVPAWHASKVDPTTALRID